MKTIDNETRELISPRDLVQAQRAETDPAGHFGLLSNDHAISAQSLGLLFEPLEDVSSQILIPDSALSPPTFDWNQWVSQVELSPAPSAPVPDISNNPPSVLVNFPQNPLIEAHSTCQCHKHSADCVKNARFATDENLVCTCCHSPFHWIHGPTATNFEDNNYSF